MIIDAFAFNLLDLAQDTNTNIKGLVVHQFLGVYQNADQNFEGESVSDHLYISQLVTVVKTLNLGVAHTLAFSQGTVPRGFDEEAFQFLTIQQEAVIETQWPLVTSQLSLAQMAVAAVAKAAYNTLELSHEVTVNVTRNLIVAQTLTMNQAGRAYKPDYYWTSFEITVVEP